MTKGKLVECDFNVLNSRPVALPCAPDLPAALLNDSLQEQGFQESLSRHSEYIPRFANLHHGIWFNWILYKYPLPTGNVVDFAYLETTSVQNTIVLIEIEDPKKKMWKGPPNKPGKAVDFNAAIEQVTRWRTDLKDPVKMSALIADFKAMMGVHLKTENAWNVVYGLVYGRSAENKSPEQRAAYADLQQTLGIELVTYDNLVTRFVNFPEPPKNVISVTRPGPTFSYLYLNAVPHFEFSQLPYGTLNIEGDAHQVLVSLGYDISAWEVGEPLVVNGKKPRSNLKPIVEQLGFK